MTTRHTQRGRGARLLFSVSLLAMLLISPASIADSPQGELDSTAKELAAAERLHMRYSALLGEHVEGIHVDYEAWASDWDDLQGLRDYVDTLASLDPKGWPDPDAIAYWINLYNSLTVLLILDHYPVKSIKDIGGAWKDDRVVVSGLPYSLNGIENDVLRGMTRDARIHFALNCASVGCPPLRSEAYFGSRLDEQLENATTRALQLETQLILIDQTVVLSKIFDWYERDFEDDAGSVADFIERYRDDLPSGDYKIETMDYDWSLNGVSGPN